MYQNSFLLIGYSNIVRKRIINVLSKNKLYFSVASKSFTQKIKGAKKQFENYDDALLNSGANIAYISLPNSMHFYWAKKALLLGYHVIIDKPICYRLSETRKLIALAKKKRKLLSEAIFFNYHEQIKKIVGLTRKTKEINKVNTNFTIPLPSNKSILMSKKLQGGVIMDMGPYAASIHRIFFNQNITYSKISFKKNKNYLPTSFKLKIKYKEKSYSGLFKFGGRYMNEIEIFTNKKKLSVERVFSPPDDLKLNLKILKNFKTRINKIKKDNCFENYLFELIKKINNKKYSYYYKQIESDHMFREKIEKKYLKTF
jgi:NDP-hexose-3-ketoreductase